MKPEELRIGNLVYWDEHVFPIAQINSSGFYDVRAFNNIISGIIGDNKINPIPITEEWLIKFGFELKEKRFYPKKPCSFYIQMNGVRIAPDEFDVRFYIGQEFVEHIPNVSTTTKHQLIMGTSIIRYVHQLQNLWFILLSEELTIQS